MHFADTTGVPKVYQRILDLCSRYGDGWQPAPLLARLAESGESFSSWNNTRR
jgi:3-hydroxyacyl-CoA dehydrogenase